MDIRYLGGSGFLVTLGTTGLLFDASDLGEFPGILPSRQQLASFTHLYVFISQTEEGHYSPRIRDLVPSRAEFITSSDFPEEDGHRLAAGESLTLDDLRVTAYDSTDQGVAFLVETAGVKIFHAGSLNLWHWRDISTVSEIEAAEKDFNACLAAIPKNAIDLAFFPVDPRQGSMFDAGAGAFLMTVKPKLLIPMHFQDRADAAHYFASTNETNATRISVLEKADETLTISFPEEEDPDEPLPVQMPELPEQAEPDEDSVPLPAEAEEGDGGLCPQAGPGGSPASPSSPLPAQQNSSTVSGSEASPET